MEDQTDIFIEANYYTGVLLDHNITTSLGEMLLLDCSFNPPTLAHQYMLTSVLGEGGSPAPSVVISLSRTNVEKAKLDKIHLDWRLYWMRLMAQELSRLFPTSIFSVIWFNDAPIFYKKITLLRRLQNEASPIKILMGDDTAIRLFDSRFYGNAPLAQVLRHLFSDNNLVIFSRKWNNIQDLHHNIRKQLEAELPDCVEEIMTEHVQFLSMPVDLKEISSTTVRNLWRRPLDGDLLRSELSRMVPVVIMEDLMKDGQIYFGSV